MAGWSLVVNLATNVAKFQSDMTKAAGTAQKSLGDIDKSVNKTGQAFTRLKQTIIAAGIGYAVAAGFRRAMQAVDDFRQDVIGVAATLTDLAKDQNNPALTYALNLKHARDMYRALEIEAAKHFATGRELQMGYNVLIQKGVNVRKEDIGALATVIDKIKLMTKTQGVEKQINQELRALVDGRAKSTDQLAKQLKDRLGGAWEQILKQHRDAGDLLQWLSSLFPGLQEANADILDTLNAQKATLETHLTYIGREGLAGMYDYLVDKLKEMNDYLKDHGDIMIDDVKAVWEDMKPLVLGVWTAIKGIASVTGTFARNLGIAYKYIEDMSGNPAFGAVMGAGIGFRTAGLPGALAGAGAGAAYSLGYGRQKQLAGTLEVKASGKIDLGPTAMMELGNMGLIPFGAPELAKSGGESGGKGGGGKGGGRRTIADGLAKLQEAAWKQIMLVEREITRVSATVRKSFPDHGSFSRDRDDVVRGGYEPIGGRREKKDRRMAREMMDMGKDIAKGFISALMRGDLSDFGLQIADAFIDKVIDVGFEALWTIMTEGGLNLLNNFMEAGQILMSAGKTIFDFIAKGAKALVTAAQFIMQILKIAASVLSGGFFHSGGSVMHSGGPIRAHGGLSLTGDEVPAILQRGEFVVQKSAVRRIGVGRLAAMNAGGDGGGGGGHTSVNIYPRYPLTRTETEYLVRRKLIPAMNKYNARSA